MMPTILILAAGRSARMRGADKLMQDVAGQPLLRRMAERALATGASVTVALPPDRPLRDAALTGLAVDRVTVADPGQGMAASLAAGVAACPADRGVLLLLADLPDLTTNDLCIVLATAAQWPDAILRGTAADGTPGHPVLFPPDLRDDLLALRGDEGARSILARHATRLRAVPLPDRHAVTDLDTPEDWAGWRARQTGG